MTDESLFAAALALPAADRPTFLDRECPDPAARRQVEGLLAAHAASNPLDRPPADLDLTAHRPPSTAAAPTAAVGDRVGPYKLLEKIGEGGMGDVWVADQLEPIKRRVALKLIKPGMDSRSVLGRFEAERQALAVMDHPNIAKVLDAGTTADGRPYFVMELVKGTPITEFADARKLTPKQRLELFVPVCQAIQHAHMKGIIHRDIKPSNVLVALHDETPVPKVIDFGVAKAVGQQLTEKTIYTGFGALVGTPTYMAPEQATFNQLDIDTRADVYALGVLLYELLAGSPPIEKERLKKAALDELLRIVRDEEPPRPSARLSTSQAKATIAATRGSEPAKLSALMKGELDWIVMKALEKDRTRRYETANGFAADIQRYLSGEQVQAVPPSLGYRLAKAYRKNKPAVLTGGLIALVLLAGIGVSLAFALMASRAEERATANEDAARRAEADALAERDKVKDANADLSRAADMQRRTRYAAEMNLLQAAYNAHDFQRVRRLLLAQIPKPGEPDLRGPEWHFWHRKFNSHDSEFRFDLPKLQAGSWPERTQLVLAPNGGILAVVIRGNGNGLWVQFWNVASGTRTREIELAPDTGTARRAPSAAYFSTDSERLLVEDHKHSVQFDPSFRPEPSDRRAWIMTVRDGQARDVHSLFRNGKTERTTFTPDLRGICVTQSDAEKYTATHTFRDLSDKELGRIRTDLLDQPTLCPDRTHVLTLTPSDTDMPARAGGRKSGTYAYWKFGDDKPLWEWSDEPQASLPEDAKVYIDGKTFQRWVSVDGAGYWKTNNLATGQPISSVLIGQVSDFPQGYKASSAIPNREGTRLTYQRNLGLVVHDLGSHDPNALLNQSPFTYVSPPRYDLELYEGHIFDLAFTPDGRVVSVSIQSESGWDGILSKVIVRAWTPPRVGWNRDGQLYTATASPDRKRFAFVTRAAESGDPNSLIKRIVVLDAEGGPVFAADVPGSRVSTDQLSMVSHSVGFSNDGRYLVFTQAKREGNPDTPARPTVVWDLDTKREVLQLACEPGSYFQTTSETYSPFDATAARIVLALHRYSPGGRPVFGGGRYFKAARVFELPSGKPMYDLKLPDDAPIWEVTFQADELLGARQANTRTKTYDYSVWDARTGEFRGTRNMPKVGRVQPAATQEWSVRGDRAVRHLLRTEGMPNNPIEIWDAAKRRPTDRPICTIELENVQKTALSPDGSRLLVVTLGDSTAREALYCTTTGRELIALPQANYWWYQRVVFSTWSRDGNEYWFGVNPDGKPCGNDFRPLPEPKK